MGLTAKNRVGCLASRQIYAIAALLPAILLSLSAAAQSPKDSLRVLTNVSEIRALSTVEAARKYSIRLTGVITYVSPEYRVTFFQDDTAGIYLFGVFDSKLAAGNRVQVDGNTTPGEYAPSIENAHISVLGPGTLPAAPLKSMDRLLSGVEDSQWVAVQGIVHSVNIEDRLPPDMRQGPPQLVLLIAADGAPFASLHAGKATLAASCGLWVFGDDGEIEFAVVEHLRPERTVHGFANVFNEHAKDVVRDWRGGLARVDGCGDWLWNCGGVLGNGCRASEAEG